MSELEHYGVKGMKWGVRKDNPRSAGGALAGVPASTNRMARKDATEAARAKMFYGQGAGTRRKLINNSVAAKSSRDPAYKKAFDYHSKQQDMASHAAKARGERKRKDVVSSTAKTARGIKNLTLQTGAPVTVTAVAAYKLYNDPVVRSVISRSAQTTVRNAKNYTSNPAVQNILKNVLR